MRNRKSFHVHASPFVAAALFAVLSVAAGPAWAAECPIPANEFTPDPTATTEFLANRCHFASTGWNPFFILQPGYQIVMASDEEVDVMTVTDRTRTIDGVETRVVLDLSFTREGNKLVLAERTKDYYAVCRPNNTVFYFGEDSDELEDGEVVEQTGWHAGRHGARPGIIMPGTPLVGGKYYEEIAPEDEALDKAKITAVKRGCEAGEFSFPKRICVTTANTSDCESGSETKVYAAGIGPVIDEDLELVRFGFIGNDD
jgi:hypothetical protein